MNCLYISVSVSLSCPNVVLVSALSVFSLMEHLFVMSVMCVPKDSEVLYVTPRILVLWLCRMGVLFSVTVGVCWCSFVKLVSSVVEDFAGATLSLLVCSQSVRVLMYGCAWLEQVSGLWWVDVMERSSAYEEIFIFCGGLGMSCM